MLVPSVSRLLIAALLPASRRTAAAAQGRSAPVVGSIAPMPYALAPLIFANWPPTTILEPSGARVMAMTCASAVGAQLSSAPLVGLKAASLVRATLLAVLNAPPT